MGKLPMDADILPPSDDRIFKVLLTHPNAKQVLMDIISTVIEQKVLNVQIRNNEVPIKDVDQKNERFDVNCTIENGVQVDVEMHCSDIVEIGENRDNFINKYTYYLADLHSTQESVGVVYKNLVRTFQITFTTHTVFPKREDFASWFTLRTKDGEQFTDQMNLIIIELSKLHDALVKPVDSLTSFEKWLLFLKFASEPMHRSKINDIIKDKEEINMASTLLQEISKNERERARFRSRKMYETDMYSNMKTSEEIGELRSDAKWQVVVTEKDAAIADKDAIIFGKNAIIADKEAKLAENETKLADKEAKLVENEAKLADKEAENERLRLQIAELQAKKA